jgi:molecular chaperone GrpE
MTKEKDREKFAEKETPELVIRDRRFWKRADWNPEDQTQSRLPSVLERLEEKVRNSESAVQDVRDKARRVQQEADAYRQRLERDVEKKLSLAKGEMLREWLDVLDDLDRSLTVAQEAAKDVGGVTAIVEGLRMVRAAFIQKLAKQGVEMVDLTDQPYDPELAEAIDVLPTKDPAKDNCIVAVLQPAYRMDGRTLRAARVRVARLEKAQQESEKRDA